MAQEYNNTIVYSEALQSFDYFSDVNPISYMYINGDTYFIDKNNNIVKLNGGYSNKHDSYEVRFVSSNPISETKIFDSADIYTSVNGDKIKLDEATYSTSNIKSGIATDADTINREGNKKVQIPRSAEDSISRLRDKYVISNYSFSIDGEAPYYFTIPYIKTKYRQSFI